MYEAFFALRGVPFTPHPDARLIVCRAAQRELIARLRSLLLEEGSNVALTGVAGAGKSIAARQLARSLPERTRLTVFSRPPESVRAFILKLLPELSGSATELPVRELVGKLRDRILQLHRAGITPLVIIDDAHRLHPDVMSKLSRLMEARIRGKRALPTLLLGRHASAGNLARGEGNFVELGDRQLDLPAMSLTATREFVQHKLRASDGDLNLITPAALKALHKRARGIPRQLDIACDKALQSAYLNDSDRVDVADVRRAFAGETSSPTDKLRLRLPRWALLALPVLIALAGTGGLLSWWSSLGPERAPQNISIHTESSPANIELPNSATSAAKIVSLADFALSNRTSRQTAEQRLLAQWGSERARPLEDNLCRSVRNLNFKCMQGWGSWQDLERLNRPAILTLWHGPKQSFHAVVARLDKEAVTLDIDGELHQFPRSEVQSLWHGEYLVLWQPPLQGVDVINASSDTEAVQWLHQAMAQLDGQTAQPDDADFDWPLVKRVMAFQSRVGLKADGTVGPGTFIALTSALGSDQSPRILASALN